MLQLSLGNAHHLHVAALAQTLPSLAMLHLGSGVGKGNVPESQVSERIAAVLCCCCCRWCSAAPLVLLLLPLVPIPKPTR